ncbi:tetratricopeptide repeat protein 25-like [Hyposmocoma kahamanoa]|uniref:tetratricopeptide repeat protein 25-like n=1 Tax=Hyposmocoma kahamanoa TaxID=1477025 RepID=UPI000E6D6721|nr:tetratricopeptide repeat protein 25-like [Hyposmocoma kahamanoa]
MEPKPLFMGPTVYRERGAHLRRLEQFDKAKDAYDEAYKITQSDVRMLTGRSQVCSAAMQPNQAYADAEMALKLEPNNMIARNMQSQALYTISDFERSIVMNYRGFRVRKQPGYFKEGIDQGIETLQDCIGVNAGSVMTDFLPLIYQNLRDADDEYEPSKVMRVSRIPQTIEKKKMTQLEARKQAILAKVLAMKYLGSMASDKFFLMNLVEDDRLMSANKKGSCDLKYYVQEALRALSERQRMLRAQKPYYAVKLAEKTHSHYQRTFKEQLLIKEREVGAHTAEHYLRDIAKSLRELRIKDLINTAERMQLFLDTKTLYTLPDKQIYTDRLYRMVGEGYLSQHRISYKLSERGNRNRIAFLMGLPCGRSTSFDSVRANYPTKFTDVEKATAKTFEVLEMCENSTMRCWLMYEMARLLCLQKNYALSKFYAKRCQRQAQELGNVTWWLNGCYILMSGDMQQGNANEVRIQVEEAWEWSKETKDEVGIQSFLSKCAAMAGETMSVDERKAIDQRERDILKIMDDKSRVDTHVLFKRMSTVPAGRRFSVLPRKPEPGAMSSARRKYRQRGLSVVQGPELEIMKTPQSGVTGLQIFNV